MTGANVPRVSLQRTFTILLLLYWSVHTLKLSYYHLLNYHSQCYYHHHQEHHHCYPHLEHQNPQHAHLFQTFPSVALVAALLAGGALLAHVDPYGEVPIKLCHHLSIICHRLTKFCYHLTIICHRLTNCCHHLTIICHYLYQLAAVPSVLLLGSWGKALLWE